MFVMGRTDDVINVAGHRLSTGSMEAVIAAHPAVAECAVIGVADPLKGQVPRGFVVLKAGRRRSTPTSSPRELVAMVRDEIGAVAAFKEVDGGRRAAEDPLRQDPAQDHARRSPTARTRAVPSTIEDTGVLETLRPVLRKEA